MIYLRAALVMAVLTVTYVLIITAAYWIHERAVEQHSSHITRDGERQPSTPRAPDGSGGSEDRGPVRVRDESDGHVNPQEPPSRIRNSEVAS